MLASLLHASHPHPHNQSQPTANSRSHLQTPVKDAIDVTLTPVRELVPPDHPATTMDAFLAEVRMLFEAPLHAGLLHDMSRQLQQEFGSKLKASNICMLPSFHHTLPTGHEQGTILALDVGGSTFRIALIELTGRETNAFAKGPHLNCTSTAKDGMEIKRLRSFAIDKSVRALRGPHFFDWMASRIEDVLEADNHAAHRSSSTPLPMSLAWSFPIEQTSTHTGSLLPMGKGFFATDGVEGHDICDLVHTACRRRHLNVELQGIVNDASATLLSQAYRDPSTRISLIMGTGINSAVYLPLSSLGIEKFGRREQSWWDEASHVLVNTELSMFGKDVWDSTRWDHQLNRTHPLPDFQPLEYKTSGRFLGELVRLVVVEAVQVGVLFQGRMPRGLDSYELDSGLVGVFEGDTSPQLRTAASAFSKAHPLPNNAVPSQQDLSFIRAVSTLVTSRAAAYVATAVHALWTLQRDAESTCSTCTRPATNADARTEANGKIRVGKGTETVTIACNGSIMEKYPDFKRRCQGWLDELVMLSAREAGKEAAVVRIEMAVESSVFGAAVAAAAEG